MRAYGLPRDLDIEFPDLSDIATFGLKSSVGNLPKKGGTPPPPLKVPLASGTPVVSGKRGLVILTKPFVLEERSDKNVSFK